MYLNKECKITENIFSEASKAEQRQLYGSYFSTLLSQSAFVSCRPDSFVFMSDTLTFGVIRGLSDTFS